MANGTGAEGGGPFDLLPLQDNFDDVLHLLDLPGLDNAEPVQPPPVAAPVHNAEQPTVCSRGPSGDNLLDWSEMLGNHPIGDGTPSVVPPTCLPVHGGQSTSTSSSPVWQENVLDCSGCQVLREVVHSNGFEATKLCIHGEASVFYHATLDVYRINSEGLAPALTHHSYVDFRGQDYEWVKHYLTDYALRRAGGNFAVVHDSLAAFHDVLCTTMNRGSHVDDAHTGAAARNGGGHQLVVEAAAIHPMIQGYVQPASGPSQPSYATDVQRPFRPVVRTALAIQRERTGKLQLNDIAPYFHLPIAEAAIKLDICPTALKGVCRKFGIPRWPHRKVRSIDRQIAKLANSGNGAAAKNEIERLIGSRRRIFAGLE